MMTHYCTHTQTHARTHTCAHARTHTCAHARTHTCTCFVSACLTVLNPDDAWPSLLPLLHVWLRSVLDCLLLPHWTCSLPTWQTTTGGVEKAGTRWSPSSLLGCLHLAQQMGQWSAPLPTPHPTGLGEVCDLTHNCCLWSLAVRLG